MPGAPRVGAGRVREAPGCAGPLPALLLEGFVDGLVGGITTSERNLRFRDRSADQAVASAYEELAAFAQPFGGWVRVEQLHGARVLEVACAATAAGAPGGLTLGGADGLLRRDAAAGPGLLTVTVADCAPVFLAWPGGHALLHAGWRGTAAGILEAGARAAGVPAAELRVHVGPSIAGCCYEVGPEVVAALFPPDLAQDRDLAARPAPGSRWWVDLKRALVLRARRLGVPPEGVTASASCTACGRGFHSFRASGEPVARRLMLAFLGRARA
ncbi:MAG: polyphenol oxidase family protein [Gemmatimonadota bacterium]